MKNQHHHQISNVLNERLLEIVKAMTSPNFRKFNTDETIEAELKLIARFADLNNTINNVED